MNYYEINLTEDVLEIIIGDVRLVKAFIFDKLQDCKVFININTKSSINAVEASGLIRRLEMASELATDLDEIMTVKDFTNMRLIKSNVNGIHASPFNSAGKPLTLRVPKDTVINGEFGRIMGFTI